MVGSLQVQGKGREGRKGRLREGGVGHEMVYAGGGRHVEL